MTEENQSTLTEVQKLRIERNRVKAENLRKGKLVSHPYGAITRDSSLVGKSTIQIQGTKFVDGGGGFLIEAPLTASQAAIKQQLANEKIVPVEDPSVTFPLTYHDCLECGDKFLDSYLYDNFSHAVCDKCRDPDGKHQLITKTDAKTEFMLKDCDFDKREPPLKYIRRRNPHNIRWGEMKLYLLLQVEKRAVEIWGNADKLEELREEREEKRQVAKIKKYNKEMKKLRMDVRSSLYTKKTLVGHEHEFGPEVYNEEEDTYTRSCTSCPYSETFEKM